MSLCEEVPQKPSDAVVFSRIKYEEHEEIERQTIEFMKKGGTAKEIPIGVCTIVESRPPLRNEYTGEVSVKEYDSRRNKQQKAVLSVQNQSAYGENIYKYEGSRYFYVKLAGRYYGAGMKLNNDAARDLRDKLRSEHGMKQANY